METKKAIGQDRKVITKYEENTIVNAAVERDDEWRHTVLSRVDSVIALVAAEVPWQMFFQALQIIISTSASPSTRQRFGRGL